MLRYFLPVGELERYVEQKRQKLISAELQVKSTITLCQLHVTGSSIEGLSVPPYKMRGAESSSAELDPTKYSGSPFVTSSDVDVMAEVCSLPVELSPKDGRLFLDEASASHVGYASVVLHGDSDTYEQTRPVSLLCETLEGSDAVQLLSNEAVKEELACVAESHAERDGHVVHRTGPAINIDPIYTPQNFLDITTDFDLVPALPLQGHPNAFRKWLLRVNRNCVHWPSTELRQEIELYARCFLVGTGHVSSMDRRLEWRLSFSDPERRLAQSLTITQRKVYLLLKLIQKCFLKQPKVVVTYHLKTLLYWELEQSHPRDWREETVFERFLLLLDRLEGCLETCDIPSYFYPENNLISHADPTDVLKALSIVRQIRENPLAYLYEMDSQLWFGFSTLMPLKELHSPVVVAVHSEASEDELRLSLASCLLRQACFGTARDLQWLPRLADLLRDSAVLKNGITFQDASEPDVAESTTESKPGDQGQLTHTDWLKMAVVIVFSTLLLDEHAWLKALIGVAKLPGVEGYTKLMELALKEMIPHIPEWCSQQLLPTRGHPSPPMDPMMAMKLFKMSFLEAQQAKEQRSLQESLKLPAHVNSGSSSAESSGANLQLPTVSSTDDKGRHKNPLKREAKVEWQLNRREPSRLSKAEHQASSEHAEKASQENASGDICVAAQTSRREHDEAALPHFLRETVHPIAQIASLASEEASTTDGSDASSTNDKAPSAAGLTVSMLFRHIYGSAPEFLGPLHSPVLDLIGWLRQRHQYRMACRCMLWLHHLTVRYGGWGHEDLDVVVDIKLSPLFLDSLDASVRYVFTSSETCRAAVLPLTTFLFCVVMNDDDKFRSNVVGTDIGSVHLSTLDRVIEAAAEGRQEVNDELRWTTAVMKLGVWKMLGRDVEVPLRRVARFRGFTRGKEAYLLLKRNGL